MHITCVYMLYIKHVVAHICEDDIYCCVVTLLCTFSAHVVSRGSVRQPQQYESSLNPFGGDEADYSDNE